MRVLLVNKLLRCDAMPCQSISLKSRRNIMDRRIGATLFRYFVPDVDAAY